ncbi:MAG: NAD-dependent epimerase/dehydratase family protein [Rhodospirillales bacterium]|nr:NAD-dependent epimerase/dehydratase family protein [Rhodospirillales bacterium]
MSSDDKNRYGRRIEEAFEAAAKLAGEMYCQAFHHTYGLETVGLRYFNVFGPRQDPTSQYAAAIPAFVTHILRGESPTVYGDGEQTRVHSTILSEAACAPPWLSWPEHRDRGTQPPVVQLVPSLSADGQHLGRGPSCSSRRWVSSKKAACPRFPTACARIATRRCGRRGVGGTGRLTRSSPAGPRSTILGRPLPRRPPCGRSCPFSPLPWRRLSGRRR